MDVQLTEAGFRLADGLVDDHVANERTMLEPLSATERARLVSVTRKLLGHLS